jgi:hypothetical protein
VAQFLVKVRKNKWQKPGPNFVANGDVQADCLADLRTTECALSVWAIENDQSNLNRVLTALAANCDRIANIDYLLFDESIPTRLNISLKQTPGGTADSHANELWHRDLVELTGKKLLELASAILTEGTSDRRLPKQMVSSVTRAVNQKEIDVAKLKAGILADIKYGPLSRWLWLQRLWRDLAEVLVRTFKTPKCN